MSKMDEYNNAKTEHEKLVEFFYGVCVESPLLFHHEITLKRYEDSKVMWGSKRAEQFFVKAVTESMIKEIVKESIKASAGDIMRLYAEAYDEAIAFLKNVP